MFIVLMSTFSLSREQTCSNSLQYNSASFLIKDDTVDPAKQDGVIYRILCECGKVYIGEIGRPMQERIKELENDMRLPRTKTSVVSKHTQETNHYLIWNEVKFIELDPECYTRRVKEAIHKTTH